MSCNKCYDIHEAQKNGLTQKECLCSCHEQSGFPNTTTTSIPNILWNNNDTTNGTLDFTPSFNLCTCSTTGSCGCTATNIQCCPDCGNSKYYCKCQKYKLENLPNNHTLPLWRVL